MQQAAKAPTSEQIVSMFQASGLKQKFIFTILMIAVFRFGVHLPLYGIDSQAFKYLAQDNNLIGFIDLFSGGALANVSIFALGIGPYITSSIIMQLMAVIMMRIN